MTFKLPDPFIPNSSPEDIRTRDGQTVILYEVLNDLVITGRVGTIATNWFIDGRCSRTSETSLDLVNISVTEPFKPGIFTYTSEEGNVTFVQLDNFDMYLALKKKYHDLMKPASTNMYEAFKKNAELAANLWKEGPVPQHVADVIKFFKDNE